jgi:predicted TIM-barrel fold metal-dependent hydrolase
VSFHPLDPAAGPILDAHVHLGRKTPNTAEGVSVTLAELAAFPGVYAETSTVRDPRAIEEAVRVLGEQRVLFGSDVPFNGFAEPDPWASEFEVVRAAALDDRVRRNVLFDNARRLLEV